MRQIHVVLEDRSMHDALFAGHWALTVCPSVAVCFLLPKGAAVLEHLTACQSSDGEGTASREAGASSPCSTASKSGAPSFPWCANKS